MKLSEKLSNYRADRPDEYTMDEFKRNALELEQKLQQYKSIVKAVDPDNLPEGEVLAISKDREFLFGHLCSGKSVCENEYFFWCESLGDAVYEITHYIETKDIIKMMGDL